MNDVLYRKQGSAIEAVIPQRTRYFAAVTFHDTE